MTPDFSRRKFLMQATGVVGWAATLSCRSPLRDSQSDLTDLTAVAAITRMRNGDITAEDYAGALLDRAQRLESLNAFRVLDREMVLAAARGADRTRRAGARLGLLHGLPIPVKDSVNTRALPTSSGTRALQTFQPGANAGILEPLLAQGAIVMGKTNLHELSLGWTSNNATFGAVHNPYDRTKVPGGSSGGSAVAVAARMAPLAVAEDTLGSIRIPATMCGLCGFRPTFGRYPGDGIMPLSDNKFDQVGPLARSVEDLALFDTVITGDASSLRPIELTGVRVGIGDFFMSALDPDVERGASEAFEKLRAAGATLVRVDVPEAVKGAMPAVLALLAYEMELAISRFLSEQSTGLGFEQVLDQASDEIRVTLTRPRPSQAVYESAVAQRQVIQQEIRAHFARHNIAALAFPAVMIPPPNIGEEGDVTIEGETVPRVTTMARNAALGSCAGLASLVLPAALSSAGLPIGLEFDAPPGTDRRLLAIGLSLQRALGQIAAPSV